MTLKRSYTTEAEIPTELKSQYVPKDGRYVLDVEGFDNVESVLAKNTELLGKVTGHGAELSTKQSEIDRLTGELANTRSSSLPRGHTAIPSAKATLLEAYEPLGTPDELKTMKAEHGTFKTESEANKREKHLRAVAEALEYEPEAFIRLPSLPEFELKDGTEKDSQGNLKKTAIAKVKGADNVVTEKPGKEFIEGHADYKPFILALTAKKEPDGTLLPNHGAGGGSGGADLVEQRNKAREAARTANPNPLMPQPKAATA